MNYLVLFNKDTNGIVYLIRINLKNISYKKNK
jgi:hypothetical protein